MLRSTQSGDCEEYRLTAGPQVRKAGYFQVTIAAGSVTEGSGPDSLALAYINAHAAIVSRLLAVTTECRLFDGERLRPPAIEADPAIDETTRWRSAFLREERGTTRVDVTPQARDDARFWWWLVSNNARSLLLLPSKAEGALIDAFAHSFDPVVVGNLGATLSQSARSVARRRTAKDDVVAVLLTRTVHSVDLTAFASPARIATLFDAALQHAGRTDDFITLHCTDWVRPIDVGSPALWTKMNSARDDVSILVDVLRRARDATGYDERLTLNALVAAELVAAIFGQPPAVFYGRDLKIDEAMRQWASSARSRRRVPAEAIDLARDVVHRILLQSPLPDRLWRSQERRAAWRDSVVDLERRLSAAALRAQSVAPSD